MMRVLPATTTKTSASIANSRTLRPVCYPKTEAPSAGRTLPLAPPCRRQLCDKHATKLCPPAATATTQTGRPISCASTKMSSGARSHWTAVHYFCCTQTTKSHTQTQLSNNKFDPHCISKKHVERHRKHSKRTKSHCAEQETAPRRSHCDLEETYSRCRRQTAGALIVLSLAALVLSCVGIAPALALNEAPALEPVGPVGSGPDRTYDTSKVAALASKLEHWLTCNRLAALAASNNNAAADELVTSSRRDPPEVVAATAAAAAAAEAEAAGASVPSKFAANSVGKSVLDSADRKSIADAAATAAKTTNSPPKATLAVASQCKPHFDGHVCWPATQAGTSAQVQCPRLNWVSSASEIAAAQVNAENATTARRNVISSGNDPSQTATTMTNTSAGRSGSRAQDRRGARQTNKQATLVQVNNVATLVMDGKGNSSNESALQTRVALRKCNPKQSTDDTHLLESTAKFGLPANEATATAQWDEQADYSACMTSMYTSAVSSSDLYDPTDQWIKLDQTGDSRLFDELIKQLERIEANIDPYSDPNLLDQWLLCIGNIMRGRSVEQTGDTADTCPIIFDGWRCWPSTRAGDTAYVSCPSHHPGFIAERKAHKICTLDGDWYRHPMTNRYWSNYTTCVDTVDLAFRTKIVSLYVFGNLISLVALAASLIIFISFKSLNCTRVTIHKNLFLSFITNNLMWIIWYTYVVNDADLLQSNPIECQFWHILLHYFLVSNYFWMFCEGLYLHTLLVVAFVSEDKILKWFYLLGWLTPVPITMTYAYNRAQDDYYTNFCWMEESPHNVILMAPIGISLLLNLIFLINIVRVLVTKLRANNSPDTHQTRKAVRATLILIPLLGLHYILTPFRPEPKSEYEVVYEITAAICTSFQGLCVAMLFCFCNGEVIAAIKKKLKDTCIIKHRRRTRSHGTFDGALLRSRSNTNSNCETTVMTQHHNNYHNHNQIQHHPFNNHHLNNNNSHHHFNHPKTSPSTQTKLQQQHPNNNANNNNNNNQTYINSDNNNHTLQSVISSSSISGNNQTNSSSPLTTSLAKF